MWGIMQIVKYSEIKLVLFVQAQAADSMHIETDYLRIGQLHISSNGHAVISLC